MISISEEDRDVVQFLLVDDLDKDALNVRVLRFARVVFGVATSPSFAAYNFTAPPELVFHILSRGSLTAFQVDLRG